MKILATLFSIVLALGAFFVPRVSRTYQSERPRHEKKRWHTTFVAVSSFLGLPDKIHSLVIDWLISK